MKFGLFDMNRNICSYADAAEKVERPADLGELEISISPPHGMIDPETVAQYAALGVNRLILLPPPVTSIGERLKFIDEVHQQLINA